MGKTLAKKRVPIQQGGSTRHQPDWASRKGQSGTRMPVTAELCSYPNEVLLPEITIVPLFLPDTRAWGRALRRL